MSHNLPLKDKHQRSIYFPKCYSYIHLCRVPRDIAYQSLNLLLHEWILQRDKRQYSDIEGGHERERQGGGLKTLERIEELYGK